MWRGFFVYTHITTMRKETLKALGINVSEDVNAGDLLRMQRDELMEPETAYRIGALRELCEEFCDMTTCFAVAILSRLISGRP